MARLTEDQAFAAMRLFLEGYWRRLGSDDVALILSDIESPSLGETADPAAAEEWRACVEAVLSGRGARAAE